MRSFGVLLAVLTLGTPALAAAQGNPAISAAEPFKLGTFEIDGEPQIGIVLRDALVIELNAANRPLLQEQLRLLEAEMAGLQAEIDGLV